ncbi:MAG: hypothetical protein SNJ82_14295 [Gemmataceae bacterium]
MNRRIKQIINGSDSRFLTKEEMRDILNYTNSLPARFKAATQAEQQEAEIVRWVIDQLKPRYPNMEKFHLRGWERGYRDVQLTFRYIVQAMILDDVKVLEDKLLFWLRTMLAGVDLTPQFIRDTYELLTESCEARLSQESFELLAPFLNRTTEVLADIPEPAVASV